MVCQTLHHHLSIFIVVGIYPNSNPDVSKPSVIFASANMGMNHQVATDGTSKWLNSLNQSDEADRFLSRSFNRIKYYSSAIMHGTWDYLIQEVEQEINIPNFPVREKPLNSNSEFINTQRVYPASMNSPTRARIGRRAYPNTVLQYNMTRSRTLQLTEMSQRRRLRETKKVKRTRWSIFMENHTVAVYLVPTISQWLLVMYMMSGGRRDHSQHRQKKQTS